MLRKGHTKSCGCYRYDQLRDFNTKTKTVHGVATHDAYRGTYHKMISRCYNKKNKNYHQYGGRGITVCEAWLNDPSLFVSWAENNGYKRGLQLDRIDNNGNYEPDNCRFVTSKINNRNRRNNVFIEVDGEKKTQVEWIEELGCHMTTLIRHRKKGTVEDYIRKARKENDNRKN